MMWLPVVEKDFGQERFLVEDPNDSFREGRFQKVNVMVGVTSEEFIEPVAGKFFEKLVELFKKHLKTLKFQLYFYTYYAILRYFIFENSNFLDILKDENALKVFNENFDEVAPRCFYFEANEVRSVHEIGQILKEFYLPFDTIDVRSFKSLNNLFADGIIGNGVHRFVHYISNFTDVYYYKFSYAGRFSTFKYPNNKPYGVHHADDVQYCFNANYVGPKINKTDPENLMVEIMTRIWSSFAATG